MKDLGCKVRIFGCDGTWRGDIADGTKWIIGATDFDLIVCEDGCSQE